MWEILAFGTVWFWIFASVVACIIAYHLFDDNGTGATFTFILSGIVFYFLGGKEALTAVYNFAVENPGPIIGYSGAYFGIGIAYSFIKWFRFLILQRNLDRKLKEHDASHTITRPLASDHKGDIIRWISYWPLSSIITLFNDPIRKFINFLFITFSGTYDRMSAYVYKDVS